MNDPPFQEPRYDLGVLLVHGIGQAREGDTLLRFGEPLRAALGRLAQPAEDGAAGAAATARAEVSAAWLTAPAPGQPAHAELEIANVRPAHDATGSMRTQWLVAEAWWAAQFPAPSFGDVAAWAKGALPNTLFSHVDRRFRRSGYALAEHFSTRRWGAAGLEILRWHLSLGFMLASMLALPVVIVLLLLLPFLAALPRPLDGIATWLQRVLASTVGDSYAFKQNRFGEAAIVRTVRDRLEWLAARSRKVVVVAHSQGAAIAHKVLRGPLTAPCDLFVSFGSGLAKLSEIERSQDGADTQRSSVWGATIGSLGAAACMLALGAGAWSQDRAWQPHAVGMWAAAIVAEMAALLLLLRLYLAVRQAPPGSLDGVKLPRVRHDVGMLFVAAAALATGGFVWRHEGHDPVEAVTAAALAAGMAGSLYLLYATQRAWQRAHGRHEEIGAQQRDEQQEYQQYFALGGRPGMRWVDMYTRHDPVPNGPLLTAFRPRDVGAAGFRDLRLESDEVCNLGSALRDHTAYWDAADDFVQRTARMLLRQGGIALRPVDAARASARRRWRVGLLRAARGIGLAAAASVAFGLSRYWPSAQASVGAAIEALVAPPPWPGPLALLRPWLDSPWMAALLLWSAMGLALGLAWDRWSRAESAIFHEGRDFSTWAMGGLAVLAVPLAGMLLLVGFSAGPMAAVAVLVVLAVGAMLLVAWIGDALVRISAGGPAAALQRIETDALKRRVQRALAQRDWPTLISAARTLAARGLPEGPAALQSALDQGSTAAALELAWFHEGRRDAAAALEAYEAGAALGDPLCARSAGYRLWDQARQRGGSPADAARALAYFRQAVRSHDASSCSQLYVRLGDTPAEVAEKAQLLEQGVALRDDLSAKWMADRIAQRANSLPADEARRERERAARLYRQAFDWGYADGAAAAGEMYLEAGDVVVARRAFTLGARLRSARAALGLARLEEQHAEDPNAALSAYRWAQWLAPDRPASLWFGMGRVLQALGRKRQAREAYAAAMDGSGDRRDAAQAGVALARLMREAGEADAAKATLLRACSLRRSEAVDAYVALLVETGDVAAAVALPEDWSDHMAPASRMALAQLLAPHHGQRSFEWARRALAARHLGVEAPRIAALLAGTAVDRQDELLQQVADRGPEFSARIAEALAPAHADLGERLKRTRAGPRPTSSGAPL